MNERRKDILALSLLLALMVLFFVKILFTHKIVRAPDIMNEYYWTVMTDAAKRKFLEFLKFDLRATWDIFSNSGYTLLGGSVGGQFLFPQAMIHFFFPQPASVAWHMVLHFFLGAAGLFCYCRAIGASRSAAFLAGTVYALSPEMASLINAGHVMKIATISMAPWALFFLEMGFKRRRVIFFMTTGLVLALQFFYTHWQITYYTCLSIGFYAVVRTALMIREESGGERSAAFRLIGMNLVTLFFFLSTVAISLIPLAKWSTDTNRGVESGANQGKGGLNRDEAMSWSMPPEETAAFVIPGLFGFSRQEAGTNPANIHSYYWGRMVFTQTTSYFGLLPWMLVPLPLLFRRDRYTLLAMLGIIGGIVFSMGKYTFVYNMLFDYFPGINRFRVPKMMMFIPLIFLGVMAARGFDILRDDGLRQTRLFRRYLMGLAALLLVLISFLVSLQVARSSWLSLLYEYISQPTRYEQGAYLIDQRWNNILIETGFAAGFASLYAAVVFSAWRWKRAASLAPVMLLTLYLVDVGRVDAKFLFLTDVPVRSTGTVSPVIEFLSRQSNQYRVVPIGGDPAHLSSHNIPVLFTPLAVQQVRWQEVIDIIDFQSSVLDMLNVRYLLLSADAYREQRGGFGLRYVPVFRSPDGTEVVLENRNVMPKAWLVPSVFVVESRMQTLQILQNPGFNPRNVALVEAPAPIAMKPPNQADARQVGGVTVDRYEGERIELTASTSTNSLLVLGEKYYQGWRAEVDSREVTISPVNNVLRGVYLTPGSHRVSFIFDPLPFKIGKFLTLASLVLFAGMLLREWLTGRKRREPEGLH